MKRRDFVVSSALGGVGLFAAGPLSTLAKLGRDLPEGAPHDDHSRPAGAATRKILIAGGNYGTAYIKYMAQLTGKERPKILYLPTASADKPGTFMKSCEGLNVEPSIQDSFINSARMDKEWDEVLLAVDGIVASGGNTLNQQVIWKAQGIDKVLRRAWNQGIVLGGASAGSLCWFEEGTTDSRPKHLSTVQCLGLIKGSHSPHYDSSTGSGPERRPLYRKLIGSGQMKPGYACYNDAGIYFEGNAVKRVVKTREDAKVFYVSVVNGKVAEKELPAEMIS